MDGLAVTVLLRHDLPDKTHHFDWLLENPDAPGGSLISFRLQVAINSPDVMGFDAVRLGDHRRAYLTYEGEVSGERGFVTRVAAGRCRFAWLGSGGMRVTTTFGMTTRTWDGQLTGEGGRWQFTVAPIDL